ncbi:zinc-binding dehydrogenase [Streptomyces sp. NPDC098789]|uniref:zinc-binding dehydrogenase n=1 Tax=Streptomyces sp. NPDC098789 TaxID=3366098 RepID=UPI00381C840A
MKAFVLRRTGEVAVIAKSVPEPGPHEVVVRITAALLCASDVRGARRGLPAGPDTTLGHEAVGVVHALGSEVTGLYVGQRVAVGGGGPHSVSDGSLAEYVLVPCPAGHPDGHDAHDALNAPGTPDTTQAPRTAPAPQTTPARETLTPVPDAVSDHQALYATGPLSGGFAAAERAELRPGHPVAVLGQGAVGLSTTIAARLGGAGPIIAVESRIRRQKLALHFGADVVVDPAYEDTVERIMELTGGTGVDVAIEAVGADVRPDAADTARRIVSRGGRIVHAGCAADTGPEGARTGRILRLIESGQIRPTAMTTHAFDFDRVERAYELLAGRADGIIKPLIVFPPPGAG